jgi:hypothetical protein
VKDDFDTDAQKEEEAKKGFISEFDKSDWELSVTARRSNSFYRIIEYRNM